MSKCDLKIVLDKKDATYQPGEVVSGTVHVEVNEEVECQGLTLSYHWRTHGQSNLVKGGERTLTLFRGRWQPGEPLRYSFDFEAPAGPLTYRGERLHIGWFLEARADIPWASDPKSECELRLHKGSYSGPLDMGPRYEPPEQQQAKVNRGCVVLLALAFLLFGLGLLGPLLVDWSEFNVPQLFVGLGSMVVGGGIIFLLVHRHLAERKLGEVRVELSNTQPRPGEPLNVIIRCQPPGEVEVAAVKVKLQAEEVVSEGHGEDKSTHHHKLFIREVTVVENQRVSAGQRVQWRAALEVPPDAAPTFMAHDNSLLWSVHVHVDVPGWPDWWHHQPITVRA